MLISFLLQLHLERKEKPPKCEVASLGITVHAEFSFGVKCFILMHLWQWKAKWTLMVIRFKRVSVCYPFLVLSHAFKNRLKKLAFVRMVCLSIPKKSASVQTVRLSIKKKLASVWTLCLSIKKIWYSLKGFQHPCEWLRHPFEGFLYLFANWTCPFQRLQHPFERFSLSFSTFSYPFDVNVKG